MAVEVKLFDAVEAAARDAGGALGRATQPCLFDRLDWFRLVEAHTPRPGALVVRARNGVAEGWLFLSREGTTAYALGNPYSLRWGPVGVCRRDLPLGALVYGLRKAGISALCLAPLTEPAPLAAALRRRGWAVGVCAVKANRRIATAGLSFDAYWAARPSRLRNTARRRARAAALDIRILDRFDATAWADYEAVYRASWKPAEGSPAFLRALAEQEGAAGTLRLGLAYHDGRPVAAQLWLVENGLATIHKLAYRQDAAPLSPGILLSMAMFRRALDVDHVAAIDFGTGDEAFKAEWMSETAPLYQLQAFDLLRPTGVAALASKLVRRLRSR